MKLLSFHRTTKKIKMQNSFSILRFVFFGKFLVFFLATSINNQFSKLFQLKEKVHPIFLINSELVMPPPHKLNGPSEVHLAKKNQGNISRIEQAFSTNISNRMPLQSNFSDKLIHSRDPFSVNAFANFNHTAIFVAETNYLQNSGRSRIQNDQNSLFHLRVQFVG